MGAYISMSSEVDGRALIGAWALKGTNTVIADFLTESVDEMCNTLKSEQTHFTT